MTRLLNQELLGTKETETNNPTILELKDQRYQLLLPKEGFNFPSERTKCRDDGEPLDGFKGAGKAWDTATPTASSKASTRKKPPRSQPTSKRLCAGTPDIQTAESVPTEPLLQVKLLRDRIVRSLAAQTDRRGP